ncbi:MAG: smalltalk protein [Bacteroides sp.]|nr:smalltalk protein [Bacteroides sp.]
MENKENKTNLWGKILKVVITVLTAIATTLGVQACCSL